MGILALDETDRVIEWQEKPKQPKSDLASMGVYVFSKKTLRRWLAEDRVDFGRERHPGHARRRRPRLRLPLQRLLAGRRHDPVVLGSQHGAPRRQPGARPVRQGLGHPHPLRGTGAGQGRPDRPGPPEPDQPRLRHRRDRRQLASCRRACGSTSAPSCATRSSCSTRSSGPARWSTGRSSTRRSSSARARSSATGPTTTAEQAGAGPPEHGSRSSASARSCRAASGSGATSRSPRTCARPTSPDAWCAAAIGRDPAGVARAARAGAGTRDDAGTRARRGRRGRRRPAWPVAARRPSRTTDPSEVASR